MHTYMCVYCRSENHTALHPKPMDSLCQHKSCRDSRRHTMRLPKALQWCLRAPSGMPADFNLSRFYNFC